MHQTHTPPGYTPIRKRRRAIVFATCAVLAACNGTSGSHTAAVRASPVAADGRSRTQRVIRQGEIRASSAQTAYEAVMRLRPGYLVGRGNGLSSTRTRPWAIVQKGMLEPIDALKLVPAEVVREIRFIEPSDAVIWYGAQYSGGIVVVLLVNREKPQSQD